MSTIQEIVISTPLRTAIGTFGGMLKEIPAADLGATVAKRVLEEATARISGGAPSPHGLPGRPKSEKSPSTILKTILCLTSWDGRQQKLYVPGMFISRQIC